MRERMSFSPPNLAVREDYELHCSTHSHVVFCHWRYGVNPKLQVRVIGTLGVDRERKFEVVLFALLRDRRWTLIFLETEYRASALTTS